MSNFFNELKSYQSIPRELVFDQTLSDRARFVYVFMACKPEGWDFFLEPMAKEIKYSVDTLRKYINELVANGWLEKGEQENENGRFGAVSYILKATKITDTEIFRHGKNPTQDNRDYKDKQDYKEKEENIKRNRNEYSEDFEKAWVLAQRKGSKTEAYKYWKKLKEEDKAKVLAHLPFYYKSNDRQYLKDFSGYLNRGYYSSIVCDKQGHVLYDPEKFDSTKYTPQGRNIWFDEGTQSYWSMDSFYDGHIYDGYDDGNRPDGAEITLNNGRGNLKWSSISRKWEKV